jgi:hypothetical protein
MERLPTKLVSSTRKSIVLVEEQREVFVAAHSFLSWLVGNWSKGRDFIKFIVTTIIERCMLCKLPYENEPTFPFHAIAIKRRSGFQADRMMACLSYT